MQYISAPWRGPYVRTVHKTTGCVFCRARRARADRDAFILHRGALAFVILNKYPYVPGHLMVAPCRHLSSFERSDDGLTCELSRLLRLSLRVLRKAYRPQGFNVGMNLGRSAGAGVVGHYHIHVVPRWAGDSNFMPIFGDTRIILEDLKTTYEKLRPLFDKEARRP